MVQLGVGNDIIVVVPEVTPDTPDVCCLALCKIHRRIDTILLKSCIGTTLSERSEQFEILHNQHHRSRDGCIFFGYAVRVKKYAEQYCIKNKGPKKVDLDRLWTDNGFGINVEVCGYARLSLALLRMKHFAYIETYKQPSNIRTSVVTFEGKGDLNRNPALGAYMRPDFIVIYYIKIIHHPNNCIWRSGLAPHLVKQF